MIYVVILLVLGAIMISCEENGNSQVNWNFEYPLTIGSSWEYDKTYTIDYHEDAEAAGLVDEVHYGNANVLIKDYETIFDTLNVYNFETTLYEDDNVMISNEYYNVEDSCFIEYAYNNGYQFTPKGSNLQFRFNGKLYNDVRDIFRNLESGIDYSPKDSIYYDPVLCLKYPLELSKKWKYRGPGNPWLIEKEIIGKATMIVTAGTFKCWVIRWTFPQSSWDDDLDFRDYISEAGLIKRVIEFRNTEVIGANGMELGHCDISQTHKLQDFELAD